MKSIKFTYLWSILLLAGFFFCEKPAHSQTANSKKEYDLSSQARDYLEGYARKLKGEELVYSSLRDDVSEAFLTRANTGKMEIEWESQTIPAGFKAPFATLIWLASFDLNSTGMPFDVYINDILRFTFTLQKDENWKVTSAEGGELSFVTLKHDIHKDAQGYTLLKCPATWLTPGKPLKIKILGQAKGSNAWYMVFKANNVVGYLNEIFQYKGWYNLSFKPLQKNQLEMHVSAPAYLAGRTMNWQLDRQKGVLNFKASGDESAAKAIVRSASKPKRFVLMDGERKIFAIDPFYSFYNQSELHAKSMVQVATSKNGDVYEAHVTLSYTPSLQTNLQSLASTGMRSGKILLMNSSHQDIAWMDSPEKCIIERDTMLLTPLFNQAERNPTYRFDIEDVLMVREFLGRHPERKAQLADFLKKGLFSCGATYQMPYEEMYSGESLIRQFYLGARWLKKELGGYQAVTYWNVDVPGRTSQMPQIMRKSGVKYLVLSRQEKGVFNWFSPDGSWVTTYSPGHYGDDFSNLNKEINGAADYVAKSALSWIQKPAFHPLNNASPVVPLLSDNDMSPAKDYSLLMDRWNSIHSFENEKGDLIPIQLPKMELTTSTGLLDAYTSSVKELPAVTGERPAVWLYIHGPTHQKATKASREGDRWITSAEKFSSIRALIEHSFRNYPEERLAKAWEAKIYPDHGWGGKNGDITDALFESKFQFALSEAKQMTRDAVGAIAGYINTTPGKGIPVIVFNPLSWNRTSPARARVSFKQGEALNVKMIDTEGNKKEVQLCEVSRHPDGSLNHATLVFIADNVPSLGYKTFYIQPVHQPLAEFRPQEATNGESDGFRIEFANGGIRQIVDKESQRPLLETGKLLGGEVFTMQSVGTDAGEFADIQHPTMNGFDKTSNYTAPWRLVESGPVYDLYQRRGPIHGAEIEEKVLVYKHLKQIDFEVGLRNWTGELFREFRFALPLNMKNGEVAYEVPFGTVRVGKDEMAGAAGERYTTPCREMHPRAIMDWIGASKDGWGVTLSSSVAVADYLDPTDSLNSQTILQPLLLASRKSCHWEGNFYPQTGDHDFKFSLFSHSGDWHQGNHQGVEANIELLTVVDPVRAAHAELPEKLSFFSTDHPEVMISTLKKCEDDEQLVLRYWDASGSDGAFKINTFTPCLELQNTNMLEEVTPGSEAKKINGSQLNLPFTHQGIETVKLKFF